jgi:hypothetical protein
MPTVTCPFCSESNDTVEVPAGKRLICRRCGESFTPVATSSASSISVATSPVMVHPARAFLVPAFMSATLFVVVFSVGIYAIFFGKSNRLDRTNPEAARATLPWEYLPREMNLLVDVAPRASGKSLDGILNVIGLPTEIYTQTLQKMGLNDWDIAQLTLALVVANDALLPRAVIVVQLKSPPASPEKVLQGLGAKREGEHFKLTLGQVPMLLNRPRADVYLFATDVKDFKPQALTAAERSRWDSHLARLPNLPLGMLIADSDDWSKKPSLELLMTMRPKSAPVLRERAKQIRTVVVGLSENGVLDAEIEATDKTNADKLATVVAPAKRDGNWWKLSRMPDKQTWLGRLSSE